MVEPSEPVQPAPGNLRFSRSVRFWLKRQGSGKNPDSDSPSMMVRFGLSNSLPQNTVHARILVCFTDELPPCLFPAAIMPESVFSSLR
jgi:hypothetical protein